MTAENDQTPNINQNPKEKPPTNNQNNEKVIFITRVINTLACLLTHYSVIRLFTGATSLMDHPATFFQAFGIHILLSLFAFLRITGYAFTGRLMVTKSICWILILFIIITPLTIICDAAHMAYAYVTMLHCILAFMSSPDSCDPPTKKRRTQKNSINWTEMIRSATSPSAQPA